MATSVNEEAVSWGASLAFHDNAFRMLAGRALEGPEIESRVTRLNPCQIHLRGAFWAPRAIVHVRVCGRIFELRHMRLQLIQAGALPNSQPPDPGTRLLPVIKRTLRQSGTNSESFNWTLPPRIRTLTGAGFVGRQQARASSVSTLMIVENDGILETRCSWRGKCIVT
jgi:hypothetical protein